LHYHVTDDEIHRVEHGIENLSRQLPPIAASNARNRRIICELESRFASLSPLGCDVDTWTAKLDEDRLLLAQTAQVLGNHEEDLARLLAESQHLKDQRRVRQFYDSPEFAATCAPVPDMLMDVEFHAPPRIARALSGLAADALPRRAAAASNAAQVTSIAFANRSSLILTGRADGKVQSFPEVDSIVLPRRSRDAICAISFSGTDDFVLVADRRRSGLFRRRDQDTFMECEQSLLADTRSSIMSARLVSGDAVVVTSDDGIIQWVPIGGMGGRRARCSSTATAICWASHEPMDIVTAHRDGCLRLWDFASSDGPILEWKLGGCRLVQLFEYNFGMQFVAVAENGKCFLSDLRGTSRPAITMRLSRPVRDREVTLCGESIFVAAQGGFIERYTMGSSERAKKLHPHASDVTCVCGDNRSGIVASGDSCGVVVTFCSTGRDR
jgi:WD40 repeat protein